MSSALPPRSPFNIFQRESQSHLYSTESTVYPSYWLLPRTCTRHPVSAGLVCVAESVWCGVSCVEAMWRLEPGEAKEAEVESRDMREQEF